MELLCEFRTTCSDISQFFTSDFVKIVEVFVFVFWQEVDLLRHFVIAQTKLNYALLLKCFLGWTKCLLYNDNLSLGYQHPYKRPIIDGIYNQLWKFAIGYSCDLDGYLINEFVF